MRRRRAVSVVLSLVALPLAAVAQPTGKRGRIGVLAVGGAPQAGNPVRGLPEGLRDLGYVEGQSIAIEWRWAQGSEERFPELAADLVRAGVDVIVASNDAAIAAARKATASIPIVMVLSSDAVGRGFVASLARPGGNVTGLTVLATDLAAKQLQILKEMLPSVSRVALLRDSADAGSGAYADEAAVAARGLGLELYSFEVRRPDEIERAFAAMIGHQVGAVLVRSSSMLFAQRGHIADLAKKGRLPAMAHGEFVRAGCLLSYGPNFYEQFRRAAYFVDRLLKGARPAGLPVEQPTKFELMINRSTANALGVAIPSALLLRADQVIG